MYPLLKFIHIAKKYDTEKFLLYKKLFVKTVIYEQLVTFYLAALIFKV